VHTSFLRSNDGLTTSHHIQVLPTESYGGASVLNQVHPQKEIEMKTMRSFAKIFVSPIVFGALAVVLTLVTSHNASAQAPPNGLNVTVLNTPLPVVDVENPARSPFQVTLCNGVNLLSFQCGTVPTNLTTPNRRVVVEYTSGFCFSSPTASPTVVGLSTTVSGVSAFHQGGVPQLTFNDGVTSKTFSFAQQVRIYADPTTTIEFTPTFLGQFTTGGNNYCRITLSGYTLAP
jgi:hypothetical protein